MTHIICCFNSASTREQLPYSSLCTIISFVEISIYEEISVVKDVFAREICYTCLMDTADHALPAEQLSTCATHPMGRAIRLLGDMWTLMIVYHLLSGSKRFGELLEAMGNVSPKTVSQRLKMLEEARFVERQAFAEIPPRVEYSLTEKGLALVDIMQAIRQFAEQYLAENEAASPTPPSASQSCKSIEADIPLPDQRLI